MALLFSFFGTDIGDELYPFWDLAQDGFNDEFGRFPTLLSSAKKWAVFSRG